MRSNASEKAKFYYQTCDKQKGPGKMPGPFCDFFKC
mgnify:CR=1 FL=1